MQGSQRFWCLTPGNGLCWCPAGPSGRHPVTAQGPPVPTTRSSLLRRVRDPADADGWREFVALYEPLLLAYARGRGLSEDDARDAAQEVFARLVRVLPEFQHDRSRGRFRTWLWQVAGNTMADLGRRKRRQDDAAGEWARRAESDDPVDGREPDGEWVLLYRRRLLAFALEQVQKESQPKTWTCFQKHILEGRPSAEVAAELGVTANAVDVNSSRLLVRVRGYCEEYLEELADGPDALSGGA